ncbi:putative endo-1,3-beta-glucanase [Choiromyces venosus 120613-1]|uniref:glucan endo-1,3-beta-D-glucosidase n=1 Tax=Choiromyces venosus 120613-1 TaxID=1336337 RepID=A0A3N4K489_9PEZI|nr:putative endo-1,3-beta-glucanase [Choiromyces venosus 120613-1]
MLFSLSLLCLIPSIANAHPRPIGRRQETQITSTTVQPEISVSTSTGISSTAQIPAKPTRKPATTGTIITELDYRGHPRLPPFPTGSISTSPVNSTIANVTFVDLTATSTPFKDAKRIKVEGFVEANIGAAAADPFTPIGTGAPPAMFTRNGNHPVPRKSITNADVPMGTNKFYSNLFLENQDNTVFLQPYSVWWNKGTGQFQSWGLSVSHTEASQLAFGPNPDANPVRYYINPIGIEHFTFSASEFKTSSGMTLDDPTAFSINLNLLANPSTPSTQKLTFPLCQGQGFITGLYTNLTPIFDSAILFRTLTKATSTKVGATKYKIVLEDGNTWLLYATRTAAGEFASPVDGALDFTLVNNHRIQASSNFNGIIQIAKIPADSTAAEDVYDASFGLYCTGVTMSAAVDTAAAYSFNFAKSGVANSGGLLGWALPHHIAAITAGSVKSGMQMRSTTKGVMTAVAGDVWTMTETNLATNIGFYPWKPDGAPNTYSAAALTTIRNAVASDIAQDMDGQSNLNSMYYSGKALSKFAFVCFVAKDIVKDTALTNTCVTKLKAAFNRFSENTQVYPLIYDTVWKGLVSNAIYATGDAGQDFGNGAYNDHHFHYGYHVHAAAVLGYLDSSFLTTEIKDYVNSLIRDFANPATNDPYFPFMRSMDWYHGHSWAKGIFASSDGKDQESTSEDYTATYALKLWGTVTNQPSLVSLAITMLAVQRRSIQSYFLLESTNTNQPANFIANKVTGILFENKVDYTTYFGNNKEYIHGIQMIPLSPVSPYVRSVRFVNEELQELGGDGFINGVVGGWRGLLVANKGIVNPKAAWDWFAQSGFDNNWLDGGASKSWYLAWTGGMAGV